MDIFLFSLFPNTPRHPKKYEVLLPSFMQRRVTRSTTKAIGTVVLALTHLWFRRSRNLRLIILLLADDGDDGLVAPAVPQVFHLLLHSLKLPQ